MLSWKQLNICPPTGSCEQRIYFALLMHSALLCLCKEEERSRTGTQTRSRLPRLSPMAASLHPSPRKQPGGRGRSVAMATGSAAQRRPRPRRPAGGVAALRRWRTAKQLPLSRKGKCRRPARVSGGSGSTVAAAARPAREICRRAGGEGRPGPSAGRSFDSEVAVRG